MIVRTADPKNEAAQILSGVRDFISRMDYDEFLPEDREAHGKYIIELLSSKEIDVFVAEHEGKIVAGIGLMYTPLMWNPDILHSEELFWWAADDAPPTAAIRVMKHALAVFKKIPYAGKKMFSMKSLTSSPESVGALYRRMGLREVETSYIGVF